MLKLLNYFSGKSVRTMTLNNEEKERIEEEEIYRHKLRSELSNKSGLKSNKKKLVAHPLWKKPWFVILFIIITFSSISSIGNLISKSSNNSPLNSLPAVPTLTQEQNDKKIQDLANTFCSSRATGRNINLGEFYKMMNSSEITTFHNTHNPAVKSDCKKVAELCLNNWSDINCQDIAERKIWIGMNQMQLYLSWGIASDENNTVTSHGVSSQWVYNDFGPYVYLEGKDKDNLTVTSWQD